MTSLSEKINAINALYYPIIDHMFKILHQSSALSPEEITPEETNLNVALGKFKDELKGKGFSKYDAARKLLEVPEFKAVEVKDRMEDFKDLFFQLQREVAADTAMTVTSEDISKFNNAALQPIAKADENEVVDSHNITRLHRIATSEEGSTLRKIAMGELQNEVNKTGDRVDIILRNPDRVERIVNQIFA